MREFGSVVVVVGATVVVVVGTTVVEVVVAVGATVVVVVGASVVVVGAMVVEVVDVVEIVVSTVSASAVLCSESLPALSVTTAVTDHVPSVKVTSSHVAATDVS
jgi:hypothetical protein